MATLCDFNFNLKWHLYDWQVLPDVHVRNEKPICDPRSSLSVSEMTAYEDPLKKNPSLDCWTAGAGDAADVTGGLIDDVTGGRSDDVGLTSWDRQLLGKDISSTISIKMLTNVRVGVKPEMRKFENKSDFFAIHSKIVIKNVNKMQCVLDGESVLIFSKQIKDSFFRSNRFCTLLPSVTRMGKNVTINQHMPKRRRKHELYDLKSNNFWSTHTYHIKRRNFTFVFTKKR